jgi:hypothetical protein
MRTNAKVIKLYSLGSLIRFKESKATTKGKLVGHTKPDDSLSHLNDPNKRIKLHPLLKL